MLAALPWYGVLSLTWDGFAEAVFTQRSSKNGEWRTFMLDDSSDLPTAVRGGSRLFLRPFGSLSRPTTLSLTIEEFRRNLQRWPEFSRQMSLLLQTKCFVFVGVALEQFLRSVVADLEFRDRRHYALILPPDRAPFESGPPWCGRSDGPSCGRPPGPSGGARWSPRANGDAAIPSAVKLGPQICERIPSEATPWNSRGKTYSTRVKDFMKRLYCGAGWTLSSIHPC
jgi:hypothetical protein